MDISEELISKSIELGKLILAFGRVERATHHEDGVRKETDTDHTVMLGIMAPAFAKQYLPRLDLGLIAQFALVHDLVEAYADDTPTMRFMSEEEKGDKQAREAAALLRIKEQFDTVYPWITETIDAYESLESEEARYVKAFDKVLPKIVHILNKGATVRGLGHTKDSAHAFHRDQHQKILNSYGKDLPEVMALMEAMMEKSREHVQE